LIFQTLDDKKECIGVYAEGKLNTGNIPNNLTETWSYSSFLKGKDIEYAKLYCEGKNIADICPENLKEEYDKVVKKLHSFNNSFKEAKIDLSENCFFDLTPKKFLIDYCEVKNKITKHVLETYKKPVEYDFYRRFNEIIVDIEERELNVDFEQMKKNIAKDKDLVHYRRLLNVDDKVSYNLFGSITGRLSTNKNSFPILNFPKSFRNVIKPQNDWFVAFDMNAAELRTSLALVEKDQPEEDLYETISREIYEDKHTRKEVKEATTAWLYNSNNELATKYADKLDEMFWKETLINTHWDGKYVYTPFNRKIESDKFHAISYLNQSTFIDLWHRQTIKVDDYLSDKKSFIAFLLHDELVLDITDDERGDLPEIIKLIQDTQFGKFLVNVKAGKDYGNMKKLKIKV